MNATILFLKEIIEESVADYFDKIRRIRNSVNILCFIILSHLKSKKILD